jgi:hypothetical protein
MSELSESVVPESTVEATAEAAESALGTVLEAGVLETGALGATAGAGELAAIGDAMLKAAGEVTDAAATRGDSVPQAPGDGAGTAAGVFPPVVAAGDSLLRAAGDIAGEAEQVGSGALAAIGDVAGKAEAVGDRLLQAAGDVAGQAERAGEEILRAAGDVAVEAVEKAESAGGSLLRAAGDIAGQAGQAGSDVVRAAAGRDGQRTDQDPATGERQARGRNGR